LSTRPADAEDKLRECTWTSGPNGLRLLADCRALVIASRVAPLDNEPLLFSDVRTFEAGHSPDERQRPASVRTGNETLRHG
jgi:hypothetical protein